MDLNFRDYTESDKLILLSLTKKLGGFVKPLDPLQRIQNNPGFFEKSLDETLEKVNKFQGKILIAEDSGKAVGHIIGVIYNQSEINRLEIGPHKLGEVIDLFLDEDYRGQGYGKKMLQLMENYFKENGCDSMWISVFAPNENAHNIYKNYGFIDREIGMLKQI